MPAYNLPTYSPTAPVPPSFRLQKSPVDGSTFDTAPSPNKRRTESISFTPCSLPPPILQQASFTQRGRQRSSYTPSPLSPQNSKAKVDSASSSLSLRYVVRPIFYSPSQIQQIHLPPLRFIPRTKLQVDKFYEETIASILERRLREKCLRCKIGEKAGMGVSAGREMKLLAALGSCRERKTKGERGLSQFMNEGGRFKLTCLA